MAIIADNGARKYLFGLLLLALAVLAGCQVELYSGLTEREGNEMLATLLGNGVRAKKTSGKDQVVNLFVDERDVARAVNVLRQNGYPRDKFDRIGDIFKKEGLISSPTEERIRFIYALSQNVSETLAQIDGVVTARVQVVLPENKPFDDTTVPSSAAVFIKHHADYPLEEMIPQIKMIVTNSIEGLTYDKNPSRCSPRRTTSTPTIRHHW